MGQMGEDGAYDFHFHKPWFRQTYYKAKKELQLFKGFVYWKEENSKKSKTPEENFISKNPDIIFIQMPNCVAERNWIKEYKKLEGGSIMFFF